VARHQANVLARFATQHHALPRTATNLVDLPPQAPQMLFWTFRKPLHQQPTRRIRKCSLLALSPAVISLY
jgi:hypothetical protein